ADAAAVQEVRPVRHRGRQADRDRVTPEPGRTMTRMTLTVSLAAGLTAALAAVVWASADPKPAPSPRPAPAPVPLPAARGPTLLFAELVIKPGEDGSRTLRLVRVPFRDGKPAGRDEVHTADASDFGFQATYHVIADRYVVLQSATVIDLADKAVS